ncbi:MAG: hypothetical protein ACREH4_11420 [Vitreimonas sp.]
MKLPLLCLLLAALCAWGSLRLETLGAQEPIVAAARRQPERPTQAPRQASEPNVRAPATTATSAPLFRGLTAPAALRELAPGQSFALVGLAGAGPARVAFVRDEADQRTFSVRVGESVREWTVEETSDRCVLLRKARRRVNVCLS